MTREGFLFEVKCSLLQVGGSGDILPKGAEPQKQWIV